MYDLALTEEEERRAEEPAPVVAAVPPRVELMHRLQRGAGNASVARMLARKPHGADAQRRRAAKLGAVPAVAVLAAYLPALIPRLSPEQIAQLQRVIDGAVINPGVSERWSAVAQKDEQHHRKYGVYDEKLGDQEEAIAKEFVPTGPADKRIHLDAAALFTPDLFTPRNDNPDEAAFLTGIRSYLEAKGIWLLVGDGTFPEVWLSLGPEPDGSKTIRAPLGWLTQESLLETQLLGANHFDRVVEGRVATTFQREADHVFDQVESGREEHFVRERLRDDTVFGVVEVSDLVGGVDWPSKSIWDAPFDALMEALDLRNAGEWSRATATLIAASQLAQAAAGRLHTAAEASEAGASVTAKWLTRVKVAAQITETVLMAWTGAVAVAGIGTAGAGGGAAAAGAGAAEIDALAEQTLQRYLARNPELAGELSSKVEAVKTAAGTVDRGVGAGRGVGEGFQRWP